MWNAIIRPPPCHASVNDTPSLSFPYGATFSPLPLPFSLFVVAIISVITIIMSSIIFKRHWPSQPAYWSSIYTPKPLTPEEALEKFEVAFSSPSHEQQRPSGGDTTTTRSTTTTTTAATANKAPLDLATLTRQDGRFPEQQRPLSLLVNNVPQASGSVLYSAGRTRLACSLFGPKPLSRSQGYSDKGVLWVEVEFLPGAKNSSFTTSPAAHERRILPAYSPHASEAISRELCTLALGIKKALTPCIRLDEFPNTQIEVYVTIIEDDGSLLAHSINAVTMACLHAAVPMLDVPLATSMACYFYNDKNNGNDDADTPGGDRMRIDSDDQAQHHLLLDPTRSEELAIRGQATITCCSETGSLIPQCQIMHIPLEGPELQREIMQAAGEGAVVVEREFKAAIWGQFEFEDRVGNRLVGGELALGHHRHPEWDDK